MLARPWFDRFAPFLPRGQVSMIRWDVPTPAAMLAHFGGIPTAERLYGAPPPAEVRPSHGFTVAGQRISWLRFASPDLGDVVTARVVEPEEGAVATVVLGQGLMVEGELWRTSIGTAEAFAKAGLRAVELTSPWHGRRALAGWYGSEPFLGTAPLVPCACWPPRRAKPPSPSPGAAGAGAAPWASPASAWARSWPSSWPATPIAGRWRAAPTPSCC
ncbi:MAG: hypothetical protein EXQ94_05555 [Alphaproteobacteria bacterium]|nr:hypothetical protein [Alphaproteobacteria bacterium]